MASFKIDQGVLQSADLYPETGGLNTKELTNPRLVNDGELTKEIIQGSGGTRLSPLVFAALALGGLLVLSYFQK